MSRCTVNKTLKIKKGLFVYSSKCGISRKREIKLSTSNMDKKN